MSEKLGPIAFGRDEPIFLGREFTAHKDYSESLATKIDDEVSRFMKNAFKKAKDVLTKHRDALEVLAQKLIINETVERDEFAEFVKQHGVVSVVA
jgi:cell division protease FtsH